MISSPTADVLARGRASSCARASSSRFRPRRSTGSARTPAMTRAVRAIFAAKGRPADHPVIVHVTDAVDAATWARAMPAGARRLAAAFWPGPLTHHRAARVARPPTPSPAARTAWACACRRIRWRRRFCVRSPRRADAASPRRRPTASAASRRPPRSTCATTSATSVAMIVDGGACDVGIESTIVAFVDGEPLLLRPGGIARGGPRAGARSALAAPQRRRAARVGHARVPLRAAHAVAARRRASACPRAFESAPCLRAPSRPRGPDAGSRHRAKRRLRARSLCEPARARRHGCERDPHRGSARRRRMECGARPPRARHAWRRRRLH